MTISEHIRFPASRACASLQAALPRHAEEDGRADDGGEQQRGHCGGEPDRGLLREGRPAVPGEQAWPEVTQAAKFRNVANALEELLHTSTSKGIQHT